MVLLILIRTVLERCLVNFTDGHDCVVLDLCFSLQHHLRVCQHHLWSVFILLNLLLVVLAFACHVCNLPAK